MAAVIGGASDFAMRTVRVPTVPGFGRRTSGRLRVGPGPGIARLPRTCVLVGASATQRHLSRGAEEADCPVSIRCLRRPGTPR